MGGYLSHSQCETWNQCPRRWRLEKIERVPRAPSEALILGSAVHTVIENDGRELMNGHDSNDTRLHVWLDGALTEEAINADPHGLLADRYADMLAKGHAIISAYIQHLRPRYRPLAVEDSFLVDIPGAPGWTFTGRIDARVTLADGTRAIADFKTGKAWTTGLEHTKDQASAYLWASGGEATAVVFCIFPVELDRAGEYTCTPQFRPTARTLGQLAAYERGLAETARRIEEAKRSGDFPAKPGPLCGWCGVIAHCQTGRKWLADHNRKPAVPVLPIESGGDAA